MKVLKRMQGAVLVASLSLSGVSQAELLIHDSNSPLNTLTNNLTDSAPSDAAINRLMQVMQVNDMIDRLIAQQQQMANVMQNLPEQLPKAEKASIFSRKTQQQLQKVLNKYSQVFAQQIDPVKQRQAMVKAYQTAAKQHYTQAEVDALIGFYDTPMGQQILQKQSQVSTDFFKAVLPAMAGDTHGLPTVLPGLQQDIEKIFE